MSHWSELLEQASDEYLTGLANKGIVKRAYKDKESIDIKLLTENIEEPQLILQVGDEQVTLLEPLAESKCSCPSRSICRHVVAGILAARERIAANGDACGQTAPVKEEKKSDDTAEDREKREEAGKTQNKTHLWNEIADYPFADLRRALGVKKIRSLLQQKRRGLFADISGEQVLTVNVPGMEETVKLLSPVEYSTCTCHKKALCGHKAAAILWCQLKQGVLTEGALEQELPEGEQEIIGGLATEELLAQGKQVAEAMQQVFCEMTAAGLSRMSADTEGSLERLAILSHNAQLPRMENEFRTLAAAYGKYFKRSASVTSWDLLCQTMRLYQKTERLRQAETAEQIEQLGGEFRAEYLPIGNLDLLGVTTETFTGAGGYAGTTVYFLEYDTKKWYTYTHVRPTFYDNTVRRGNIDKTQAPWHLPISFEELSKVRIRLTGAKCELHGRLSSSQDTTGEVLDRACLSREMVGEWYYTDFSGLFSERMGEKRDRATLVFLAPDSIGKAAFTDKTQRLSLPLYDAKEREVIMGVRYSKEEDATIRYLERLKPEDRYVFFGKLYLKDGRIHMYPLALWERDRFES